MTPPEKEELSIALSKISIVDIEEIMGHDSIKSVDADLYCKEVEIVKDENFKKKFEELNEYSNNQFIKLSEQYISDFNKFYNNINKECEKIKKTLNQEDPDNNIKLKIISSYVKTAVYVSQYNDKIYKRIESIVYNSANNINKEE